MLTVPELLCKYLCSFMMTVGDVSITDQDYEVDSLGNFVRWDVPNIPSPVSVDALRVLFPMAEHHHNCCMDMLRSKRDALLRDSDKYVLPDFPLVLPLTEAAVLDYRQQLRDLPQVYALNPMEAIFPTL